ncbi:hypothetical protein COPG_00064 [Colwellia phage 9A]|uniref:Uncharacterized protein n=1 Tax=Colwellia phage 9A TaxID=765765 RepID=I3UME5_9CAUD|nr:hypothetical protein COPG_00064 [Colwellia phage 9A]AFK66660.1 hypothetical protein COPG_00064 [Colwellia phage 9A]
MPYKKQALQIHSTIVKSGNNSKMDIVTPSKVDPISGISSGVEESIEVNFVQTHYTSQDLGDSGIASGLTKLLISTLDPNGNEIVGFVKALQHKNAFVRYSGGGGKKVSIKLSKIVMPNGVIPILARVFIGG